MTNSLKASSIYTIGYSTRSVQEFCDLLRCYNIHFVIDVRSMPYSAYNPNFSREAIDTNLQKAGFRYLYFGDSLGGSPRDSRYLTEDRVDYDKIRQSSRFRSAIERLKNADAKGILVALLCGEGSPRSCHRSLLIGEELRRVGIDIFHVDETGALIPQSELHPEEPQLSFTI